MADKVMSARRDKVGPVIGRLSDADLLVLNRMLDGMAQHGHGGRVVEAAAAGLGQAGAGIRDDDSLAHGDCLSVGVTGGWNSLTGQSSTAGCGTASQAVQPWRPPMRRPGFPPPCATSCRGRAGCCAAGW
jgi:hypothetical protein